MFRCFVLISLLASALSAMAETTLTASIDRNKIYESDTLNLVVMGEVEVDFSLGGIMSFGRSQLEAPNTEALSKTFEILDQQQSYNMQSINGETKAQVTWNFSLAPKHTGTLVVPAIEYKGTKSNTLEVTVLTGKAPQDLTNPPQVFLEASIDKSSAYVQEQVIYTLRLYSADRLASGEMSVPESNDAIIEALGDTKKYYRMAHNRRYEVRERQYLLFPQKSGKLTIDAQSFNGLLIDTKKRQRVRVREFTDPISLDIKSPPSRYTGDTWLPASSFYVSEKWETSPENLKVGDSITRTLEIKALGLLGSALPPLGIEKIKGLKIYPDVPAVESQQHESGAQSIRQESIALVAVAPTTVTLPEIRIPWWDTLNDVERVAIIPAKTIIIAENPELASASQAPKTPLSKQALNAIPLENSGKTEEDPSAPTTLQRHIEAPPSNQLWYTLISLLLLGWFSSVYLLLKHRAKPQSTGAIIKAVPDINVSYRTLIKAIKDHNPDMPKYLITWAKRFSQTANLNLAIQSINDLAVLDEAIHAQAKAFEAQLYGSDKIKIDATYDSSILLKHIKSLIKEHNKTQSTEPLRPMYP